MIVLCLLENVVSVAVRIQGHSDAGEAFCQSARSQEFQWHNDNSGGTLGGAYQVCFWGEVKLEATHRDCISMCTYVLRLCRAQEHTFVKQPPSDPVMLAQLMSDPVTLVYLQDGAE